ncbi:MAG TPA: GDSL-type esterase/lipase family protein, partial [Hyphomicrobiales bacterium]|nr:GDSL-type esterase/lipase family protein [Hyphomicrobiales bacterium]
MFHALRDRLRRFLPALKPILCCGAFAAAAFSFMPCAPLSAKDASEAAAKAYQRHRTQRLGMFSLSKITSAPVVMLGDSLTKRAQWAEITGCPFLANRGIGGDTSAGVLSRLEESLKLRPRAVFLMIGINDITS